MKGREDHHAIGRANFSELLAQKVPGLPRGGEGLSFACGKATYTTKATKVDAIFYGAWELAKISLDIKELK